MNATATNLITYLTPREADIFQAIKESDALSIQYGKIVLNFMGGELQNVIKEEMVFKRSKSY